MRKTDKCPFCTNRKNIDHGLCRTCWDKIPAEIQRAIHTQKDNRAAWLWAYRTLAKAQAEATCT